VSQDRSAVFGGKSVTFEEFSHSVTSVDVASGDLSPWTIMKPRITVIIMGVNDLEKSVEFYRDGLGLPTQGIVGTEFAHGAVAFFDLQNGLKLALWPRSSIAHDSSIPLQTPSATEFTIGHNVGSKKEVDAVMEQAERAGARIIKPAENTFWGGYAGYFQDPDDHLWEIVGNPQMGIQE